MMNRSEAGVGKPQYVWVSPLKLHN